MKRVWMLSILAITTVATSALVPSGIGVASANEAPLADGGLDQQVPENTTVYLDAGGSLDPDGSVVAHRWHIEGPNGTNVTPACPTCTRTHFVPKKAGQYTVTVAVEDDDGAISRDRLYVDVREVRPPSVSLSGSAQIPPGQTRNYTAKISAGDRPLESMTWYVDGNESAHSEVDKNQLTASKTVGFGGGSNHTISVRARDDAGRTARDEQKVDVTTQSGTGNGASSAAVADTAIVFQDHILLQPGTLDQPGFGLQAGSGDTRIATEATMKALEMTREAGLPGISSGTNPGSMRISRDSPLGHKFMSVLDGEEEKGAGGYTKSKSGTIGKHVNRQNTPNLGAISTSNTNDDEGTDDNSDTDNQNNSDVSVRHGWTKPDI